MKIYSWSQINSYIKESLGNVVISVKFVDFLWSQVSWAVRHTTVQYGIRDTMY